MSRPFFIVGSGRSGSTLLRVVLCAHSQITIPPETYYIIPLLEKLPVDRPLKQAEVRVAVDTITGHYRWPDMGITVDEFNSRVQSLGSPYLRDIVNVIYSHHLELDGKQSWGDKTPPYVAIIPGLKLLYPDARIVHMVRDGRDVTRSFQRTGWYGRWLHDNTREWSEAIDCIEKCRRQHPEIMVYEVRYEDLVLDMENTVRQLMQFLGFPYEQGMMDWSDSLEGRIPSRETHIHGSLGRKPRKQDTERWLTEMSKRELLVTEAFIHRQLKQAGYRPYFSHPLWFPVLLVTRLYCVTVIPLLSLGKRALGYAWHKPMQRKG